MSDWQAVLPRCDQTHRMSSKVMVFEIGQLACPWLDRGSESKSENPLNPHGLRQFQHDTLMTIQVAVPNVYKFRSTSDIGTA
ncbi:MAG: hypothetical protein F6K31_02045 [Symploca sp. SIO2G7]|nr:hypothetical protein [Symploca sp. SIO2G7]